MTSDTTAAAPRWWGRTGSLAHWSRPVLTVLLLLFSAGLVLLAPRLAGTHWSDVGHVLRSVNATWLIALTGVWFAGLLSHSVVLTRSLPGLNTRQALSLNLAGSAVGNSMPLGGAVSMALTTAMSRSWGFRPPAVTTFLTLSNVWNILWRGLFGSLALTWFLTGGPGLARGLPTLIAAAVTLAVLVLLAVAVANDTALSRIGAGAGRLGSGLRSLLGRRPAEAAARDHTETLLDVRNQMTTVLRTSWLRMSAGMAGYLVLLALLLDLCLRGLGSPQPIALMLAAVGVERLVTALPITPGGAGAAELVLLACLTAGGVPAADALAATLLYRFFTYFAEIPLGAAVALGWRAARA